MVKDVAVRDRSADARRRAQLRDFLRARRARLSPAEAGMPAVGRRRTPGLRREEVAVLAGVGASWYTWLEQGRDIKVSDSVLDAIGRALRLTEAECQHLYLLAGQNPPPAAGNPELPITPELQRVLDSWLPSPACILDRYWNVQAINDAARLVLGYERDHNCLVSSFTRVPSLATFKDSWGACARPMVSQFRADAARYPDDPRFEQLARRLSAISADFAELWADHDVHEEYEGYKTLNLPDVGELAFEYTVLSPPDRPGSRIWLLNPKPGTMTEIKLVKILAAHQSEAAG
jgi:transcriptional regulator with XRE-family HTH domain